MNPWLALFQRYGLLKPAEDLGRRLAERGTREWLRRSEKGRAPDARTEDLERELAGILARYRHLIEGALKPAMRPSYSGWRPSPDDCLKLLAILATVHREPGFEFEAVPPDVDAETRSHRDGLMNYFLAHPERGRSATNKDSAASTAKAIEKAIRAGDHTPRDAKGRPVGEPMIREKGSADHLAKDYGQRNLAHRRKVEAAEAATAERRAAAEADLQRAMARRDAADRLEGNAHRDEHRAAQQEMVSATAIITECQQTVLIAAADADLPPSIRTFLGGQRHLEELTKAIRWFTAWPVDR